MTLKEAASFLAGRFGVPADRLIVGLKKLDAGYGLSELDLQLIANAIAHTSIDETLDVIEASQSPHGLLVALGFGDSSHQMIPLFYNLSELATAIEDGLKWLRRNRADLITTGFASKFSGRATPIEVLASRLYFTRMPVGAKATKTETGYAISYAWQCGDRIILNPLSLPPHSIRALVGSTFKNVANHNDESDRDYDPQYPSGKNLRPLKEHAEWIEQHRQKFFDAKVEIFEILQSALRKCDYSELWERCTSVLSKKFDRNEIEQLLRLDPIYERFHQGSYLLYTTMSGPRVMSQNGGLSELLWLVGHCEYELKTKHVSNFRDQLGDFVAGDSVFGNGLKRSLVSNPLSPLEDRCEREESEDDDSYESWIPTYLKATKADRLRIDSAFGNFWADADQFVEFWESFNDRLNSSLENDFTGQLSIRVKGKHKHLIELYVQQLESAQRIGFVVPADIGESSARPTRAAKRMAVPDNTKWTDITITMETIEKVKIKIKGQSAKTFLFSDLGFKNQTTNQPDRNWLLLRELAKNNGEITPASGKIKDAKKRVSDLRSVFAEIFGLPGTSAIRYDTKVHSYKSAFHLSSEIADDRKRSSPTAMPSARSKHTHFEDDGAATELDQLIDEQAEDDDF